MTPFRRLVAPCRWLMPLLVMIGPWAAPAQSAPGEPMAPAAILQELRRFAVAGSVLHIAAHPDDENTQLITYLTRGRGYRTAYLSITRGDGGQNLLGPQLDEQLGVARTQELLAARRLDGGQQFFTRAIDFGYSKDYRETLSTWGHTEVLGDVVRVIRVFRPDVIITRFSPRSGGHGHHTASAVLGAEAFKLAGDAKAYPEQLGELETWQPKRIFVNVGGGRGGGGAPDAAKLLRIDIGGNDPVSGESFGAIASRSRAMHKTQGFGNFGGRGGGGGPSFQSFELLDGEPAESDIMDGVDTTWGRFAGGAAIDRLTADAIATFNDQDPSASVPALLSIREQLGALPKDRLIDDKREQLDHLIQSCLGLSVQTTLAQAEVVAGETMELRHAVKLRSAGPVRWRAVRYPSIKGETPVQVDLRPNEEAMRQSAQTLPDDTPVSQPYWLRSPGSVGLNQVDPPSLIGRPEDPPAFSVEYVFEVNGQTLIIPDEPVRIVQNGGDAARVDLQVIPPVSLRCLSDVRLFAPGASRPVEIELTAARADVRGTLRLDAPEGWRIEPAEVPFHVGSAGERARVSFTVTAPPQHGNAMITASAMVRGHRFSHQRIEIRYDHIPRQLLQPPAQFKAISLDLAIRGQRVGYIAGAGDSVAQALAEMGYAVAELSGNDLTPERLKEFDAVVIGIRALNTRTDLADRMSALFAFVEAGGNLIVQYNRPNDLKTDRIAPFNLRISSDRVTDEHAAVTILAADHPALNVPNKIAPADFEGWIQERAIYLPNQWDEQFVPLLAFSEPGEPPRNSSLLVARHGKGYFVYTGLAFFRQLPEGVPGAYRLFANLVSLGK